MNNSAMICGIVLLTAMVSGIGDGQQYVHEYLAGRGSGFMPAYWGSEYEKVIDQAKLFDSIYWDPTYLACEDVYGPGRIVESMTPSENENDYAEIQSKLDSYRYTKPWMMPEFMCNSIGHRLSPPALCESMSIHMWIESLTIINACNCVKRSLYSEIMEYGS